tara:strand:- start:5946 stop:6707 length:762 start_codon:yes stop_codon:yes gene_type:complete
LNKIAERIHVAPVGFEVDRIVLPAIQMKADRVYLLIHDNRSEDKASLWIKDVKKELKANKITSEEVYANWRDIDSITKVVRNLLLKLKGNNIYINLASGSKNHAIGLDRAVMTLDEADRNDIEMFYAESKAYLGFSHPKQLSTGVREIKPVRSHRIVIPNKKLIGALKIISDYVQAEGRPIKKKELARICEEQELLNISSTTGNRSQVVLTSLDKTIIKYLKEPWKAINEEQVGRNRLISLTDEGKYLVSILT